MATNTRQTFEAILRNDVVPYIMTKVKKTGIPKNALDWIENVCLLVVLVLVVLPSPLPPPFLVQRRRPPFSG